MIEDTAVVGIRFPTMEDMTIYPTYLNSVSVKCKLLHRISAKESSFYSRKFNCRRQELVNMIQVAQRIVPSLKASDKLLQRNSDKCLASVGSWNKYGVGLRSPQNAKWTKPR